ncbi:MAG: extracellular repeat protein family [Chthonomonadales bacterium]|nr:extracellular repeat protein family [Chthonomonadales bacterium]
MITWLRRLMRTNALIGIPLAAITLLFLSCRGKRSRLLGIILLGMAGTWLAVGHSGSPAHPAITTLSYRITDIGALQDGNGESWAASINDSGQVVGGSNSKSGTTHAFLWQNGAMTDLDPVNRNASSARHICNSGLIAGSFSDSVRPHAVLWRNGRTEILDLPGRESRAVGVNDAGQVAGTMGTGEPYDNNAFLWQDGRSTKIGSFIAHSINAKGDVAGLETNPQFFTAVTYRQGAKQRLFTPEYEESAAFAINDQGVVAGYCGEWMKEEAALWEQGQLHLLGKLGSGSAEALALNDRGQVVGSSEIVQEVNHAFLWQEGKMRDLNTLVPPDSNWVLMRATGINACGQIVGSGQFAGKRRAFLLTPTGR